MNSFSAILEELRKRLDEPPPGRVQILVGPRQVGKTTLLLELGRGLGSGVVYVAADSPEASLPGWWELLWQRVEGISKGGLAVLLLDEASYLPNGSRLLKAKIDQVFREKLPIHVVVTGSSALHLGRGAGETMAGRFERLHLTHWPASELAGTFGLDLAETVGRVVVRGSYPGSVSLWNDPPRWRSYILESIIEPAIGRDILMLENIRKPGLLRQIFGACAGHPAEIVSLQKLCGLLTEKGALETVAHYLQILERAYLVAPLQKRIAKRYEAIHLGTRVARVEASERDLTVSFDGDDAPGAVTVDRILVAVGRRANGDQIGADAAGVEVDERGVIAVDDRMRTNVDHIHAIGDIVGNPMLAHKASHQGVVAAEVIAGGPAAYDVRSIPSVAYTDPEIAWTGLTETAAKADGVEHEVASFPWAASGRALGSGRSEGRTKLIVEPGSRRLLGAGIVGVNAGELIAEAVYALEKGSDAEDLALTVHPHPTLSETVMFTAQAAEGTITDLYLGASSKR